MLNIITWTNIIIYTTKLFIQKIFSLLLLTSSKSHYVSNSKYIKTEEYGANRIQKKSSDTPKTNFFILSYVSCDIDFRSFPRALCVFSSFLCFLLPKEERKKEKRIKTWEIVDWNWILGVEVEATHVTNSKSIPFFFYMESDYVFTLCLSRSIYFNLVYPFNKLCAKIQHNGPGYS